MAEAQNSVLVYGYKSIIDTRNKKDVKVVGIPKEITTPAADWLREEKGISLKTLFPRTESYSGYLKYASVIAEDVDRNDTRVVEEAQRWYKKGKWKKVIKCVKKYERKTGAKNEKLVWLNSRRRVLFALAQHNLDLKNGRDERGAYYELFETILDNACCHNEECIDLVGKNKILKTLEVHQEVYGNDGGEVAKRKETVRIIQKIKGENWLE